MTAKRVTICIIVGVCVSLPVQVDAEPITCALIPDKALGFADSATFQLLQVELSKDSNLVLLERAEIEKVLEEQTLQLALTPEGGVDRRRFGALLKADLLVFLRAGERIAEEDKTIRFVDVVVADSSTGLRIVAATHVWDEEQPEGTVREIGGDIEAAREKMRQGIKAIVAVPPFVSEDLTREFDVFQEAYAETVRRDLGRGDGIFIVAIEEAQHFAEESVLTDSALPARSLLPLYVMGRYRHEGIGDSRTVKISVEVLRGQSATGTKTEAVLPTGKAADHLHETARRISEEMLNIPLADYDPDVEIRLLTEKSTEFERLGEYEKALNLAQTALLLRADDLDLQIRCASLCQRRARGIGLASFRLWGSRNGEEDLAFYLMGLDYLERVLHHPMTAIRLSRDERDGEDLQALIRRFYALAQWIHTSENFSTELNEMIENMCTRRLDLAVGTFERFAPDVNMAGTLGVLSNSFNIDMLLRECTDEAVRYRLRLRLVKAGLRIPSGRSAYDVIYWVENESSSSPFYLAFLDDVERLPDPIAKASAVIARLYVGTQAYDELLRRIEDEIDKAKKDGRDQVSRLLAERLMNIRMGYDSRIRPPRKEEEPENVEFKIEIPQSVPMMAGIQFHPIPNLPPGISGWLNSIPGVDVVWRNDAVFEMSGQGQCRKLYGIANGNQTITDVRFDGDYLWLAMEGMVTAFDQRTGASATFATDRGLPPGKIRVAPWAPGHVCLVGSFERSWIANVTFDGKEIGPLDVFHEARMASGDAFDAQVAFYPSFVVVLGKQELTGEARILIGRTGNGEGEHYPLVADPLKRTVEVLRERFSDQLSDNRIWVEDGEMYSVSIPGEFMYMQGYPRHLMVNDTLLWLGERAQAWRMASPYFRRNSINGNIPCEFGERPNIGVHLGIPYVFAGNRVYSIDPQSGTVCRLDGESPESFSPKVVCNAQNYGLVIGYSEQNRWFRVEVSPDSVSRYHDVAAAVPFRLSSFFEPNPTVIPRDPLDGSPLSVRVYGNAFDLHDKYALVTTNLSPSVFSGLHVEGPFFEHYFAIPEDVLSASSAIVVYGEDQRDRQLRKFLDGQFYIWSEGSDFRVRGKDGICVLSFSRSVLYNEMLGDYHVPWKLLVDALGRPLAGGEVEVLVYPEERFVNERAGETYGFCNKDTREAGLKIASIPISATGEFRIPRCPNWSQMVLRIRHPEYGTVDLSDGFAGGPRKIRIDIVKKGTQEWQRAFRGKVVDANGKPMAGLFVGTLLNEFRANCRIVTDEEGMFAFYRASWFAGGDDAALRRECLVSVSDPRRPDTVPWIGKVNNSDTRIIEFEKGLRFHRFRCEDAGGNEMDPETLHFTLHQANDVAEHPPICKPGTWQREVLTGGCPIRDGVYEIRDPNGLVYPPLSVSNESPEVLTFRKAAPAVQRYVGQVVEAETGQPMEGILVFSATTAMANGGFIALSDEDWEKVEEFTPGSALYAEALDPFRRIFVFDGASRTDGEGRFQMEYNWVPGERRRDFVACRKGYIPSWVSAKDLPQDGGGETSLRTIMMYRSAKVTLTMNCEDPLVNIHLFWRSEVDGNPDWARHATSFGKGYVGETISPNQRYTFLVPANVQMRFKFDMSPTSDGKTYTFPELPIEFVGLGEEKDLGVWELVSEGESGKGATK